MSPLASWFTVLVVGATMVALLYAVAWPRRRRPPAEKPDVNWDFYNARIQYSALHRDGSRTIYPSEAAYRNDPVWNRQEGAITYGRAVRDNPDGSYTPLGPWVRTYGGHLATHRRED